MPCFNLERGRIPIENNYENSYEDGSVFNGFEDDVDEQYGGEVQADQIVGFFTGQSQEAHDCGEFQNED